MNDIAIKAEGLGKIYRLGLLDASTDSVARSLARMVRSPLRNFKKYRSLYDFSDVLDMPDQGVNREDILWALKDVSFEIPRGQVVGIIGVNGAGKSTLLKVLSRVTPPTTGHIAIGGRVSSLLEVGTGFHPELTGRENVYLNGTVLGMRQREVDQKFDEIVDFAGTGKYLDTPVKRYSSGMRVRLAFAVAAHLEPEILIIDEVLAVGDAEFQKKCLSKMESVGKSGRTVLFVSHNMAAVSRLCQRAFLLKAGQIIGDDDATSIVSRYLTAGHGTTAIRKWEDPAAAPGDKVARLRGICTTTSEGDGQAAIDVRQPVGLKMEFDVLEEGHILLPYYDIYNDDGVRAFTSIHNDPDWHNRPRPCGPYKVTAWIPGNLLNEGTYYIRVTLRTPARKYSPFSERDAIAFTVFDRAEGDSSRGEWVGKLPGTVRPALEWDTEYPAALSR